MPSEPDIEVLNVGATVRGRYEVVRRLKIGGMGAVYEVVDRETSRRRAMKTLLPSLVADPDLRARFQLEVRVAANVESEHIVEVFDAGVDDATGLPFLVMELLKGESLASLLERRGRFPPEEVVQLLFQASLALDRTHAAGIVHRDLKPENLFLTRRDDGMPRLKVLDFGIAKITSQTTTPNTTRNLGTPLYMSPEQIRGDGAIGSAADLYSLGHIAFCLLAGQPYWTPEGEGSGVYALLVRVAEGAKEPASVRAARSGVALSAGFDAWFMRATARSASERFGTASELVEELARVFGVSLPGLPRASLPSVRSPAPATHARSRELFARGADSMGALSSPQPTAPRLRHASKALYALALVGAGAGAAVFVPRLFQDARPETQPLGSSESAAGGTAPAASAASPAEPAVVVPASPAIIVAPAASSAAFDDGPAASAAPRPRAPRTAPARVQKQPAKAAGSASASKQSYDPTDFR